MYRQNYSRLTSWIAPIPAILLLVIHSVKLDAADPKTNDTSLAKVPSDAEAYSSVLRLGEMIETIGKSRAWKLLWEDEAVQQLWKKTKKGYDDGDGEWEAVKKFLDDPANKGLPGLIADAFSQEIFFYSGKGTGDVLALFQETIGTARYGQLFQKLRGDNDRFGQARIILRALMQERERLRVPDMVFGFKVSDPAKVTAQLRRLDTLLADALNETPLKGASSRDRVSGDEFLVLKLDASLIPWDSLPLGMIEEKEGEFAPLIERLKKLKAMVSVGVREGYLLIAVGESTESLAKFGGNGPKLSSRPEFKPLVKFADRPLTSIGYVSAALQQAVATSAADLNGFADLAKEGLEEAGIEKQQREALEKDIDALVKSLSNRIEKPGAELSFSFRTPTGWESYDYDYSARSSAEARPLTLLNHLGGDPILAAVGRSGTTVEDYRTLVKWIKAFAVHGEKILLAKSPESEEHVKTFHREFVPLLKKLNDTTEKLWLPALEDGQEAFVLDAKWASKRWHKQIPESERALPMLELGIVVGVSDSTKLEEALGNYRSVINQLIEKIREQTAQGALIPPFEIPKPEVERKGGKTFAHYPIPAVLGLDPLFEPTGGLSKTVGVLSLSRGHSERLLTETPLKIESGLLAESKKPLDSVFYVNWAGLIDTVSPWVGYVQALEGMDDDATTKETIGKVMKILKVFRSYASITYREEGATITRSEGSLRDLEPGK